MQPRRPPGDRPFVHRLRSSSVRRTTVEEDGMNDADWLGEQFEANRAHLRAVAYRMLGSGAEADDAVQEAWVRLSRVDASEIENLGGWLTTVVARVSLDMLRSRTSRREDSSGWIPETGVGASPQSDPEQEA